MRSKIVATFCLITLLTLAAAVFAQSDPLSGTWTGDWGPSARDRNQVTVALKWDGKALTGSVNPGPNAVQIQNGRFDPKTGAIHMEAKTPGRGGATFHYMIDGKLEKNILAGSWNHDDRKGDFRITKQ
jgi:hypothetical protein